MAAKTLTMSAGGLKRCLLLYLHLGQYHMRTITTAITATYRASCDLQASLHKQSIKHVLTQSHATTWPPACTRMTGVLWPPYGCFGPVHVSSWCCIEGKPATPASVYLPAVSNYLTQVSSWVPAWQLLSCSRSCSYACYRAALAYSWPSLLQGRRAGIGSGQLQGITSQNETTHKSISSFLLVQLLTTRECFTLGC